jgi:nicotinate-nucleotide adenylyltransferase
MKIGILGGSFNPIHTGHMLMAEAALDEMRLDRVFFIPANCSPHKKSNESASAKDRLAMVKAAIKGEPRFSVNDCEIKRGGMSYAVDTLKYLRGIYPKATMYWILGADSLDLLHTWRDVPGILKLAAFVAVNRPGFKPKTKVKVKTIEMPGVDISSSDIRRRVRAKKSIRYLTPEAVVRYISQNKLYA